MADVLTDATEVRGIPLPTALALARADLGVLVWSAPACHGPRPDRPASRSADGFLAGVWQ